MDFQTTLRKYVSEISLSIRCPRNRLSVNNQVLISTIQVKTLKKEKTAKKYNKPCLNTKGYTRTISAVNIGSRK